MLGLPRGFDVSSVPYSCFFFVGGLPLGLDVSSDLSYFGLSWLPDAISPVGHGGAAGNSLEGSLLDLGLPFSQV